MCVDDISHQDKCMKFTFTECERKAVSALKHACDKQGIYYKNLFELAKYVLSTHSVADDADPMADEIRLQTAIRRIKKRNAWMKKYNLLNIDPHEALMELDEQCPGFLVNRYKTDREGRVVVAHHHAFVPIDYIYANKQNLAKCMAAEQYRMDLSAADLEEARRGTTLVSISEGHLSMSRAVRYLRFVVTGQENLKDMHSYRIKQIYSQVPYLLTHLIGPAKRLLPTKIASRINVVGTMSELHQHLEPFKEQDMTVEKWVCCRLAKYEETVANLKL